MNQSKIGIDLGTTYCCCGIYRAGKVDFVPYNKGDKTVPSCVYYNPDSDEIIVGAAAKNNIRSIGHMVYDSKRFIGRNFEDRCLKEDMKHWPFKICKDNGIPKVKMMYNKREILLSANDISSEILKYIKSTADLFLHNDENKKTAAVITVPAYFNYQQRVETKRAAENANLHVIQIINEPTAAAIAYSYQRILEKNEDVKNEETLVIYDFGGGTFDVSVMKINYSKKEVTVLGTDGNSHLGGEDIDQILVDYYCNKYEKDTGEKCNLSEKKLFKLKKACDEAKCVLSSLDAEEAVVDFDTFDNEGIDLNLTRSLLNELCEEKIFKKTISILKNLLNEIHLDKSKLDDIVLVGGSSRIVAIEELLKENFGVRVSRNCNADEMIAKGATIVANMKDYNFTVKDVISHSLGTDVDDNKVYKMIVRNKQVPCENTQRFANQSDNETFINVDIYEGEGETTSSSNIALIAHAEITGIPTPNKAKEIIISITFSVDLDMILHVKAIANRGSAEPVELDVRLK